MKIKTSELIGPSLDWAVVMCENKVEQGVYGEPVVREGNLHLHYCGVVLDDIYSPSTDWSPGGPIIHRENISLMSTTRGEWGARTLAFPPKYWFGDTPLIVAMRCFVGSKQGDTVEVPDELV